MHQLESIKNTCKLKCLIFIASFDVMKWLLSQAWSTGSHAFTRARNEDDGKRKKRKEQKKRTWKKYKCYSGKKNKATEL